MKTAKFLFIIFMTLASCKKEDTESPTQSKATTGDITFYITSVGNYDLMIDGQDVGRLRRASQMPVCGDPDFLKITLTIGDHTEDLKSMDGNAWGNPVTFTVKEGCTSMKAK